MKRFYKTFYLIFLRDYTFYLIKKLKCFLCSPSYVFSLSYVLFFSFTKTNNLKTGNLCYYIPKLCLNFIFFSKKKNLREIYLFFFKIIPKIKENMGIFKNYFKNYFQKYAKIRNKSLILRV